MKEGKTVENKEKLKLEWVQRYEGKAMPTPLCNNEPCAKHSIGLWRTADGKAIDLCEACRISLGAPPMMEGVLYLPTRALMGKYRWDDKLNMAVLR